MPDSSPLVAILYLRDAPKPSRAQTEAEIIGKRRGLRLTPDHPKPEDFLPEIFDASALIIWHSLYVNAAFIDKLTQYRAIIRKRRGFDGIDIKAAAARGIPVCNVPDYGTEEVADHALALALTLCRQLFPLDAEAKASDGKSRGLETETLEPSDLRRRGAWPDRNGEVRPTGESHPGFKVIFHDPYVSRGTHKALGLQTTRLP